MRERREILCDLVQFKKDISELTQELSEYPWDCEEPLVIVSSEDISKFLYRYINSEISAEMLENWANVLECREDLAFEDEVLEDVINKIANPVLYGINSPDKIKKIKDSIR